MTVSVIGTGNLATHFCRSLTSSDFPIQRVYSRSLKRAEKFIADNKLTAKAVSGSTLFDTDLVLICTSDDAIESFVNAHQFGNKTTIVHCSGTISVEVLDQPHVNEFGVLYPLQTFTKSRLVDFSKVTGFVESKNPESKQKIEALAWSLGMIVTPIDSESRRQLHIAAVFASNFTNCLYSIADDLLQPLGLDLSVMEPLVKESQAKALSMGPKPAQTGPAKRGDSKTLEKHLNSLQDPKVKALYELISDRIQADTNNQS